MEQEKDFKAGFWGQVFPEDQHGEETRGFQMIPGRASCVGLSTRMTK